MRLSLKEVATNSDTRDVCCSAPMSDVYQVPGLTEGSILSVLAVITDATEAHSVVAAAQCSALALETSLYVLCYQYSPIAEEALEVTRADVDQDELVGQVFKS